MRSQLLKLCLGLFLLSLYGAKRPPNLRPDGKGLTVFAQKPDHSHIATVHGRLAQNHGADT